MKVLILGLGRMGQRYVTTLKNLYGTDLELTIVDPQQVDVEAQHRFNDIDEVPSSQTFDLAVDARPNRNRLQVLKKLVNRQIPRVVIEKPHASSLAESREMIELIKAHPETAVMIPFYRRFSDIFNPQILAELGAGPLVHISMTAGAIGLGCNGVHLLDIANALFESHPTEVMASLQLDSIESPRGPEFSDHGGTLVVQYPEHRRFTLNILNQSSAGATTTLYYQHGKVLINENQNPYWKWYRRDSENLNLPFYRTHMDKETKAPFEYNLNLFKMMEVGLPQFIAEPTMAPNLVDAHVVLETVALAIESSEDGQKQAWPITDKQNKLDEIRFNFT